MNVMQPRNVKGPSWANEPQPAASSSKQTLDIEMAQPELQEEPANQDGLSDLDWMRRHISKAVDQAVPDKAFEQSDDEGDVTPQVCLTIRRFTSLTMIFQDANHAENVSEEPKDPTTETILQTSRLFVRNLTFSCTEDELTELFSPYGNIAQVNTTTFSTFSISSVGLLCVMTIYIGTSDSSENADPSGKPIVETF